MFRIAALCVIALLPCAAFGEAKKDAPNCSDHPSFTRLQSYWIESCSEKPAGSYNFDVGKGHRMVEGKYWYIRYQPPQGLATKPSTAQVLRDAAATVKSSGAQMIAGDSSKQTLRLIKGGKETWVEAWADYTGKYILTIVERPATTQQTTPSANAQAQAGPTTAQTPAPSPANTHAGSKSMTASPLTLEGTQVWSASISTSPLTLVGTQSWAAEITTGQLTLTGTEF